MFGGNNSYCLEKELYAGTETIEFFYTSAIFSEIIHFLAQI